MTEIISQKSILDTGISQRIEAKYLISEMQAEGIREYIEPYVEPDPYAKEGALYPVTSLYLDSPDFQLYWISELGLKNRFKLRVRWYDEECREPVFLEIKRRLDAVIKKQRVCVNKDSLTGILEKNIYSESALADLGNSHLENFRDFRDCVNSLACQPKIFVQYKREAYMDRFDSEMRITLDHGIRCLPYSPGMDLDRLNQEIWYPVFQIPYIMEIKFTNTYPFWVNQMIRHFMLLRDSVAKYLVCIKVLAGHGMRM